MISYDESGNLLLNGNRIYATLNGGVLGLMVRAANKPTFDAVAESVGLTYRDDENRLRPIAGATIAELGAYVITPAVLDEQGNEVTPATVDDRYHANFWLDNSLVELGNWHDWIIAWMANGTEATANKSEDALLLNGIELIDPATIASPANVIL